MGGWLGDLCRLHWGLLYWNTRKSLFRIRGARGRAPCQHPSDSGAAGKTSCEACVGWADVRAFRRVCPLISFDPQGRRVCSVDAARVRPFWGRAAAVFLATGAVAFSGAVLAVFVGLRTVGYKVPITAIAWPPAWHRIGQARADYYFAMARQALEAGDVRRSYLALAQVNALDPGNSGAALMLAQFAQIGNPDFSDTLYRSLIARTSGPQAEGIAESWFRALLARGDFRGMGELAAHMLTSGSNRASAWTEGLIFAERMGSGRKYADLVLAAGAKVPAEARSVLALVRAIEHEDPAQAARRLEVSVVGGHSAYEAYAALRMLIGEGRAVEVASYLDTGIASRLSAYDREVLRLDAYAALGWSDLERKRMAAAIDGGGPVGAVLVAAHLIRYPNPSQAQAAFDRLDTHPLEASAAGTAAHLSLLCMAGVNGLEARMGSEAGLLPAARSEGSGWGRAKEYFRPGETPRPSVFLPMMAPLPLEVMYALVGRYADPSH